MSTTLRGGRLDQPEMPTGEIVLQAPPQLEQHEGASGVLMNAIPMLGSLGSIVLVASIGGAAGGGRSYLAGGMFLFATVGFIVVQIDRQRKQRAQQVTGSRTEYLRYLANVRKVAREAADQQRRALTWQHPAPSALPSLAEERSRVWEHHSSDPHFLHVRYGLCAQPLALEPGRSRDDGRRPGRPRRRLGPAPAAGRAPAAAEPARVDRHAGVRPDRGVRPGGRGALARAGDDLQRGGVPVAGEPRDRRAGLRAEPRPLGLDEVAAALAVHPAVRRRRADADGVDVAQRPGRAAAARPQRATALRRGRAAGHAAPAVRGRRRLPAARQPRRPSRRPPRRHGARPAGALGRDGRRVLPAAAVRGRRAGGRGSLPAERAAPARGARTRAGRPVRPGDGRGVRPPADPAAHRDRGRHRHPERRDRRTDGLHGPARPRRRARLRPRAGLAPAARPRPAARPHRARRRRQRHQPRHQGVRPAGHGPARAGHRRDRLRQVGVPAHARARPRPDPLPRAAQHGAGRLQGRRDVRRDVGDAARLRGDHQPGPGAHPRRPHAGRPVRRDGAPPGAAPRGRQLRVDPRLREGPGGRRGARAAAVAVHRGRRVLRDAVGQAGVHRPVRRDRPAGPVARPAPAARLATARGGPAARPGVPPVLPRRPAHVQRRRVPRRARRAGRLRAAARARPGFPQARPVDPAALQGGVRLGAADRTRRAYAARRAACCAASCRSRSPRC